MPNTALSEAIKEAYASAPSEQIILHTLELRHPAFVDDAGETVAIRVVRDTGDLWARLESQAPLQAGERVQFVAMGFELDLPPVDTMPVPEITVTLDNVSREIVKLEKEMSQVQTQYKDAEENYGSDLLNLVVAKGYLTKLLGNDAVKSYITRHEPEILEHFELVVNTVSMEEAVQQQLEADGEFEEDPDADSDATPTPENTHPDSENGNETPVPGDNAATE
jgi:hypothetical protein